MPDEVQQLQLFCIDGVLCSSDCRHDVDAVKRWDVPMQDL
jgi:hypothetical protein